MYAVPCIHCLRYGLTGGLGISRRVVSIGFGHDRRSIPRTIRLPGFHRHHFRYAFLPESDNGDGGLTEKAGPRFALVTLWYFLSSRPNPQSALPKFLFGVGIFRTLTCGGWTYVTSTDDHGWHDIFMISYLVATLPWTIGCLAVSPPNPVAIKWRRIFGISFFTTLIPLIYFFIQHKVHRVAGGKDIHHPYIL